MDTSIELFLSSLGLENLEARVYITALSYGTTPASTIANKLSIPRSTVRYTCEQLVSKGLMVMSQKANTKLFTPENPTKLTSILYDQELALKEKRTKLTQVTQILQKLYNPETNLPEVIFYEGEDGVLRMFDELAGESGTVYTFGAGDYFLKKNPSMIQRFRSKALKQNREIYIIRSPEYRTLHESNIESHYNTKYFRGLSELKVDIQMRDDSIGITSIDDNHPIAIKIKHREIAQEFQRIFKELWSGL